MDSVLLTLYSMLILGQKVSLESVQFLVVVFLIKIFLLSKNRAIYRNVINY